MTPAAGEPQADVADAGPIDAAFCAGQAVGALSRDISALREDLRADRNTLLTAIGQQTATNRALLEEVRQLRTKPPYAWVARLLAASWGLLMAFVAVMAWLGGHDPRVLIEALVTLLGAL